MLLKQIFIYIWNHISAKAQAKHLVILLMTMSWKALLIA